VDQHDWLAERFEAHRSHLRAVAVRMLGSTSEADDAVQEAWLRLSRSDPSEVENLGGWLTTVVARVSLDMLRSRSSRREELGADLPDRVADPERGMDPEHEALLADSIGPALLVVLDTLAPAERLAFVLHDMFAVPFDEIGPILGRSPNATKQLASRARRRVRGAAPAPCPTNSAGTAGTDPGRQQRVDHTRQRRVVDAFLAASRGGDFEALVALLDPEVTLRADPAAVRAGAASEVHGARDVAGTFSGRARLAQPALIGGAVGAVFAAGGRPRFAFSFEITGERIVGIEILADPTRLRELGVTVLDD
jgi:RNA polymerase sigma-70 factor, ECF subfamily